MKSLFSGDAAVYLQGDNALTISGLFNKYQDDEYAGFLLGGFKDPLVSISDHRKASVEALHYVMETEDVTQFSDVFCTPAHVELYLEEDGNLSIELSETNDDGSKFALWMPIGMENSLPVYDYVFDHIIPGEDDEHFSGLFIFRRQKKHGNKIRPRRK